MNITQTMGWNGPLIRERCASSEDGAGGRHGMTLIEVVIAMGLFSFILCAFLQLQFATLTTDRVSMLQLSGTVALRGQMEQSIASAYDNKEDYPSIAKGLLSYLVTMSGKSGLGNLADVRRVDDTIVYTFPVPQPGDALAAGAQNLFENAVGTFTVYLREGGVPADFTNWNTLHDSGSDTANGDGFDMNGNRTTGDNFSDLFGGGEAAIAGSNLNSLAVKGEILYFKSAADKVAGIPAYSVVRNFIVNGDAYKSDEIGRDFTDPI